MKTFLLLTNTGKLDYTGCNILKLEYVKDSEPVDSIHCCSGAPGRQFFRKGCDSWARSLEPLPEGQWYVDDIVWAGDTDVFDAYQIWSSGIGPVTIPLEYVGPEETDRSAIEIHIDWNSRYSPGTAGCIGIYSIEDMKKLVEWLRESDPRDLFVDWELGSCPISAE
ncbi:MAG: murein L,D-transpeptidase [Okeania sp. SIO3B5]|uniref:L,D-transpeptidase family protein n=1 Tax=Okeania sp. SIO3B5 TaxID=2607811 RepID=UPI0013FFFFE1|nr:L,D-transpeptidase family protein [Okeania sp. SIO3B5]NEO54475.1 murein L,D-transpeptidase [Okeania sp. SIO3B5]